MKKLLKNKKIVFPLTLAGMLALFFLAATFRDSEPSIPNRLVKNAPVPGVAKRADETAAKENEGRMPMSKTKRTEEILEESERKRGPNYVSKTYYDAEAGRAGKREDEEAETLLFLTGENNESKKEVSPKEENDVTSAPSKKKAEPEIKSSSEVAVVTEDSEVENPKAGGVAVVADGEAYKRKKKLYTEIALLGGKPGGAAIFLLERRAVKNVAKRGKRAPNASFPEGNDSKTVRNGAPVVPGSSSLAVLRNGADSVYSNLVPVVMDVVDGSLKGWTLIGKCTSAGTWDSLVIVVKKAVSPSGKEYSVDGVALDVSTLSPDVSDEVDRNVLQRLFLALIGGYVDYKMTKAAGNGFVEQPKNVLSGEIEKELSRYVTHVRTNPGRYVVIVWK